MKLIYKNYAEYYLKIKVLQAYYPFRYPACLNMYKVIPLFDHASIILTGYEIEIMDPSFDYEKFKLLEILHLLKGAE